MRLICATQAPSRRSTGEVDSAIFLYGRENLGGFGIFFLKNLNKLKKIFQKRGGLTPKTPL